MEILEDAGADDDDLGRRDGNVPQATSWDGHENVMQMLIDAGADANVPGDIDGSVLHASKSFRPVCG